MSPSTLTWIASVTAFAVPITWGPGPNSVMLSASGATWGFRCTVPHIFGVSLGFPVMLLAVALGASEVLHLFPWLQGALRWTGAAYLLWLAWRIATADPVASTAKASEIHGSRPLSFLGAALFQWVSPQAWVVALMAVATYTTATGALLIAQASTVAANFFAVALPACAFWTLIGVGAAHVLRTRRAVRLFNLALAALLTASLLPMLRSG
jgi:threonine/homoserine/homoserine lactone efflux protein